MFRLPRWPRCKCGRFKRRVTRTFFGARIRRWECVYCDNPTPPGYLRMPD